MTSFSKSNPFATLGLPLGFDLDPALLASQKRRLSSALHPDKFTGRPASERRSALGRAIEVNEAARLLQDPLTRAEVLLGILGLGLEEGKEPAASSDFLMETMERRESLRDAARAGNADAIEKLASQVKQESESLLSELTGDFSRALADTMDRSEPSAREIHHKLSKLRYLRRFLDEADAHLDEL